MENQLISIENLLPGDEILVSGLDLNYLKVIRIGKSESYITSRGINRKRWKSFKCKRMNNAMLLSDQLDDKEIYQNLDYKTIWLIKRENTI